MLLFLTMLGDDDDDDDDDDDVLTLAHFTEILPEAAKQVVTKTHLDDKHKRALRTVGSYQPVKEAALTSCGIPSRITCNQIAPGTYPWFCVHAKKKAHAHEEG